MNNGEATDATRRLATKKQTPDVAYAPPENYLEIDVINPITHGIGNQRYTDYEVRMKVSSQIVLRASSGIPASYLTCGSSIIQVMLASFKYLLEHKVLNFFSFIYNSSSNNCLPYVFIQDIVIAKSKKLKKNSQF